MTKIFIATPMYGGMCSGMYAQSMLGLQAVFSQTQIPSVFSSMFNESLIPRARNALTRAFLKSDCTHLFFVDADIRFNPADVPPMIAADKDVICGIYPKKEINWITVARAIEANVPQEQLKHHTGAWVINLLNYADRADVPANEPLEVFNGGTGFMLIKRTVFEALMDVTASYQNDVVDLSGTLQPREEIYEFFTTSIEPETRRLLSEDYHFCRQVRLHGMKVWAAPWVNLGHFGSYMFEGQLLQSIPEHDVQSKIEKIIEARKERNYEETNRLQKSLSVDGIIVECSDKTLTWRQQ